MRFYEYEAKELLKKHGIPVVEGGLAKTGAEAEAKAKELGGTVVVKAQVLAYGKARAGIKKTVQTPADAKAAAEELLALEVGGRKPKGVLVEKQLAAKREYSVSMTYDGLKKIPVMTAGDMRADDIEDAARDNPRRFKSRHFSALLPFSTYLAKELAASVGVLGSDLNRMTGLVTRLAQIFLDYDLTQADLTTLVQTEDGKFVVADCLFDMEIEARSRQKATFEQLGWAPDDLRKAREPTEFELEGAMIDEEDPRGVAGPVVEFDGNIGLVIGAGGGSLTLTDAVRKHGGRPANYAAIGGNPSVRKAQRLTKLILGKPGVNKIAVMSNVVSNTRADLVARGVIKGVIEMGLEPKEVIAIFRVPGAWEADAIKILDKYGIEYCDRTVSMSEAARRAVEKIQASAK